MDSGRAFFPRGEVLDVFIIMLDMVACSCCALSCDTILGLTIWLMLLLCLA